MRNMLQAGYLEDWVWNATLSGAPQGGVASPILSNIYLHRLDKFVETVLIPEYTRGGRRARNPAYAQTRSAIARARRRGDHAAVRELRKQLRSMPSQDPHDPGYRRLRYTRYADDTLLGFTGPKAEAEEIKQRLAQFLHDDLKLELSEEKTLITHARTGAARFLGYEITVQHNDRKVTGGRRSVNGVIGLRVPLDVIKAKCAPYLQARQTRAPVPADQRGRPHHRQHLRGRVPGHRPVLPARRRRLATAPAALGHGDLDAQDAGRQAPLDGVEDGPQVQGHHRHPVRATHMLPGQRRPRRGQETTGRTFGGIPLRRQKNAVLTDRQPVPAAARRKELVTRLLTGRCEICGQTDDAQVHHVRKLADLDKPGQPQPAWAQLMAKRRRKTLVVCDACHANIHAGQPTATLTQ